MRFQVPQFTEVEDRVFGPLTISQFIYLAGGYGFLGGMWLILPIWAAFILGVPVAALGTALAFLKINERPLINVLEHAFSYYISDKLYIWNKEHRTPVQVAKEKLAEAEDPAKYVPDATGSKIKDLAWSLDIKESLYSDRNQK